MCLHDLKTARIPVTGYQKGECASYRIRKQPNIPRGRGGGIGLSNVLDVETGKDVFYIFCIISLDTYSGVFMNPPRGLFSQLSSLSYSFLTGKNVSLLAHTTKRRHLAASREHIRCQVHEPPTNNIHAGPRQTVAISWLDRFQSGSP